jgi:hypothetical protein
MRLFRNTQSWLRAGTAILAVYGSFFFGGQLFAAQQQQKKATEQPPAKKIYLIPEGPWSQVLGWVGEQTQLPMIGSGGPTGVFRLPEIYEQPTSFAEAIDLLNDALDERRVVLVRRMASWTWWPSDEPMPLELPRLCDADQLTFLGRTEVVKVQLKSRHLYADNLVMFVKPFLGPLGQALSVRDPNAPNGQGQAIVSDTGSRLRMISALMKDHDAKITRRGITNNTWKATLEWLSKRTGLPLAANVMPTKLPPRPWPNRNRVVRTEEIIDLLNAALEEQQLLIIRGERALHVVSTVKPLEASMGPRVRTSALAERGKTEVVSILVVVKNGNGSDGIARIKPMLSLLGSVEKWGKSELVLQDTAGNLQVILSKLRAVSTAKTK